MTATDIDILEAEVPAGGMLEPQTRGEIDVQIVTAKRFPRSIAVFRKTAMEMATLDEETAEACFYALPRGGKTVEGPSARLAEICASAYGNLRIEARQVGEDDRFVTSRGTAWDLQTNVAIAYEVKRRITTSAKRGNESKKYDDDMVGVTSNAASSIALRNAVFKVIPAAFWKPIYAACRKAAVGTIQTLANRRAALLDHFQKMGVTNAQVFGVLQVQGVEDITLDHLATMKGLATALKDGETTIEESFPASSTPIQQPQRKAAETPAPATTTTVPAVGSKIVKVDRKEHSQKKGFFYTIVYTLDGKPFYTENDAIAVACEGHRDTGSVVDIQSETQAGKPAPVIVEVTVVGDAK